MSLSAKLHHTFVAGNKIEEREGNTNNTTLRVNLAKNQFASLIAAFTQFIGPFRLLER
jgi:hypothetical protein